MRHATGREISFCRLQAQSIELTHETRHDGHQMTDDDILRAFDNLRVWQQGDRRAPHKPLLILLALGRVARGENRQAEYAELEPKLGQLLQEFGPSRSSATRHFPFWHLATDGLWQLDGPAGILSRPPGATPTIGELRSLHVSGGFPPAIHSAFREKVLLAYEYRCCVCGHDLRLMQQVIALDAAHIKWFQAGGPDVEQNGLALCSLHHKVFDLGAFTIRPDGFTMEFSRHLVGEASKLLAYHGAGIALPQTSTARPNREFLEWHAREVFKKPARELA
jgi:putative restriction endonuclease